MVVAPLKEVLFTFAIFKKGKSLSCPGNACRVSRVQTKPGGAGGVREWIHFVCENELRKQVTQASLAPHVTITLFNGKDDA